MAKVAQILTIGVRVHAFILAFAFVAVLACGPVAAQVNDARTPKGGGASASPSADAGLKSRVDSLEEQLVDMQVVVGTLESLTKNGGNGAPATPFPTAGTGADTARIETLETQVRALTTQVQQLTDQIRAQGGVQRQANLSGAADAPTIGSANGAPPVGSSPAPGFGSTTVSAGNGGTDAIGGLLNGSGQPAPPAAGTSGPPAADVSTAALPPPGSETPGDPKQAYESAYGYLLQRDYGSAETAFTDFLQKFPNDSLSGNAQYWLGETYFVRGQYKAAAGAFLKGYQTYGQGGKAADSLLKLAMSLDRLGQKDAACSSFSELSAKFPSAPQSVKARAQSERQRIGCQ
jgi:tol-pal system protein YbgF